MFSTKVSEFIRTIYIPEILIVTILYSAWGWYPDVWMREVIPDVMSEIVVMWNVALCFISHSHFQSP